ncbi:hypothetical protein Y032_0151g2815 [Ancylostoma ceylanicum]|uniref:Uncharacterized protein n=1 Tax=Ancylostoma ceylanicum TaxID=53326 RepID=A0A016T121_9BILA|nr:hypothetical protein Y032_0151g2815 [Ancylostoma ceylanicum]
MGLLGRDTEEESGVVPALVYDWSSLYVNSVFQANRVFKMTNPDPSKRPTASEMVQEYLHVEAKTGFFGLFRSVIPYRHDLLQLMT